MRSRGARAGLVLLLILVPFASPADVTVFVIADTHYGPGVPDSSQHNQIEAVNSLPGTAYPAAIGGTVGVPSAVFVLGDLVHEDEPPFHFFQDYAGNDGNGGIRWPVYECSGNHDHAAVRESIRARHGDTLYDITIAGVRFQSLDDMPDIATVACVGAKLSAMPPGAPLVVFHHRALSAPGGYISEWDPLAVDAYRDLLAGRNVIAILFGHDHYSRAFRWEGYDTYTPGSVRHSPGTKFPESFLVMRISSTKLTIASWIFGNDVRSNEHVWVGGAWGWTAQKDIELPVAVLRAPAEGLKITSVAPNPFNPEATIRFRLPRACRVTVDIWSVRGERVRTLVLDRDLAAGEHELHWDGRTASGCRAASGVYILRLESALGRRAARLVLVE